MADGLLSNRRQSILDLDRRSFLMALDELGISGADRDNLLRQYREQASPFSGGYSASRAAQEDIAARGRRPVAFGLLSAPAEATGWDAVRGLRPEVMASVLGLLEGIGKGIDAPASAGLIPASDAPMEALGTVGMAALGSMPARVPEGALRTFGGGITTWHGSPHIFAAERLVRMPDGSMQYLVGGADRLPDVPPGAQVIEDFPMGRFRMDKMGTGEGEQAYSPGLYVAEARDEARGYRDNLIARRVFTSGMADNLPDELQMRVFQVLRKPAGEIRNNAIKALRADVPQEYAYQVNALLNHTGRLYEVDIAAGPEEFLDWDMPLAGQTPEIRETVRQIAPNAPGMASGNRLFREIAQSNATPYTSANARALAVAAQRLREAGIPGVRYFDGNSRDDQKGTRNYVLYDEDLMRIVRVYGIAGAAAMLGMSTGEVEAAVQQAQGRSVPGLIGMPSDEQLQTRISAYLNEG